MSSTPLIYRSQFAERPRIARIWEKYRNRPGIQYVMELVAEATGVFLYAYPGIGAGAMFVLGNIFKESGVGSVFQTGFAYAVGIVLALGICGAPNGGHFHPGLTICLSLLNRFPAWKAPGYIIAQIFGAYFAAVLVYYQWKPLIVAAEAALKEANLYSQVQFTPSGPAGIFALYLPPGQTHGFVFLNEFINSAFVGLAIWACLDPSSVYFPPALVPFIIGLAYAVCIWGFAGAGLALNSARDIGGRLMAMSIWGREAAGGSYAAIAALTNIVATLFAFFVYEIFFVDSDRVVPKERVEYTRIATNHKRLGLEYAKHMKNTNEENSQAEDESEKGHVGELEHSRA